MQVLELMKNPQYRSAIERAVAELRRGAVRSHYIKGDNSDSLTLRARVHVGSWYPLAEGGVLGYRGYVRRGLDNIVKGYKPREAKQ